MHSTDQVLQQIQAERRLLRTEMQHLPTQPNDFRRLLRFMIGGCRGLRPARTRLH